MIEILRSKGFWMTILVGSFIGAITGILLPNEIDKYQISEYGYVCPPGSFKNGMPAITKPSDSLGLSDFRRIFLGKSNKARFEGIIVKRNWKVGVIHEDIERGLIQVLVDSKGSGDFTEPCWIMSDHFSKKPCSN
jgi:hypothetical protein